MGHPEFYRRLWLVGGSISNLVYIFKIIFSCISYPRLADYIYKREKSRYGRNCWNCQNDIDSRVRPIIHSFREKPWAVLWSMTSKKEWMIGRTLIDSLYPFLYFLSTYPIFPLFYFLEYFNKSG